MGLEYRLIQCARQSMLDDPRALMHDASQIELGPSPHRSHYASFPIRPSLVSIVSAGARKLEGAINAVAPVAPSRNRGSLSAVSVCLEERNAVGHKRHDGRGQCDKCTPRPAESGRLEQEAQHHEHKVDPGQEDQELIF